MKYNGYNFMFITLGCSIFYYIHICIYMNIYQYTHIRNICSTFAICSNSSRIL